MPSGWASGEGLGELGQDAGKAAFDVRRELLAGTDRLEDVLMLAAQQAQKVGLETPDGVHGQFVEIAPHAGEDGDDLFLDRIGRVLRLLQQLCQTRAAIEQALRRGVEVRTEL